jgi:hypothetical protein
MLKIIDKCQKCYNVCKLESETKVVLISCKRFLSKRAVSVKNLQGKGNVSPDLERGLNRI